MTLSRSARLLVVVLVGVSFLWREAAIDAQDGAPVPLRLSASAADPNEASGGKDLTVEINITRWTTPAERSAMLARLAEGGSRALALSLVQVKSHGRIRVPGLRGPDPHKMALGWDLRYAWHEAEPGGGHRIVLGTDRYVSFWESREDPRATDYPFTLIEIRLDNRGEGVGKASAAARINLTGSSQSIALENYRDEPVRLKNVTIQK